MTAPASSSLRFTCPHCGGSVKTPRSLAGTACLCPKCGQPITAPEAGQAATASRPPRPTGRAGAAKDREASTPPPPSSPETPSGEKGIFRLSDPVETPQYQPLMGDVPDELRASIRPPQPAPPSPGGTKASGRSQPEEIRIVCRICGSRLDVKPSLVGRAVTCPDCHTKNVVKAPAARKSKEKSVPQERGEPLTLQGAGPKADSEMFGFVCQLCGTRLYATESQTGKKLACPDCDSVNVIPAPPPSRAGKPFVADGDAVFQLTDPVERPKYEPLTPALAREITAAVERPSKPPAAASNPAPDSPAPPDTGRPPTVGDDAMAKAEAEFDEKKRRLPDLPHRPLWTGVFEFFKYTSTVARWLAVSIGLTLVVVFGNAAIALSAGGAMGKFGSVVCCVAVALLAPVTTALAAACCLSITVDTASGYNEITTWPDLDFLNWLPNCFYVVNSLLASILPALPICWLLGAIGAPDWLTRALLMLAAFFLFPIALLSMLETGSSIMPLSRPIWKSLSAAQRGWLLFYAESAALAAAWLIGAWVLSFGGRITLLLAAAWLVGGVMIYFRLLGRLAWICQEATELE